MSPREVRPVALAVTGSLLLSAVLAGGVLWRTTDPFWGLLALAFVASAVGLGAGASLLHRRGLPVQWLLLVAVINLCVVAPELGLRSANFQHEAGIQFGYPRPSQFVRFEADPELFWKLRYPQPGVNSLGFPGDEFEIDKRRGVFRVLFLGDSVTYQGYPELVEQLLEAAYPSHHFEAISLAVAGYSSHQGRVLAEKYGRALDPDAVVVFFGWNDHWLAYGATDAEKKNTVPTAADALQQLAYARSRLLQATQWLRAQLLGIREIPLRETRVGLAQYRENLTAIRAVFAANDVPVIFITAPTALYRLGVPRYLVERGFLPDEASAARLHASYNQAVRDDFDRDGSQVLDLETELSGVSDEELRTLFKADTIHLTGAGLRAVAERVFETLRTYVDTPAEAGAADESRTRNFRRDRPVL